MMAKYTQGPSHFKPTGANRIHGHGSGHYINVGQRPVANAKSYGVTSVKIAIKNHGPRSIRDAPYPYINPVYAQDNFAEKYHFRKTPSGRSPLSHFEHNRELRAAHINPHMHPMEHAMVHAEPHGFKAHKHGVGVSRKMGGAPGKSGRLRLSGHTKAHQIGKR